MSIGNGRGKNIVRVAGGRFAEDIGTGFASQDIIEHGFEHDMVNASQIGRGAVLQPMSVAPFFFAGISGRFCCRERHI